MTGLPVPEQIYLDTSLVVAAVFIGSTNATASDAFCRSLADKGNTIYFSQIVRLEFSEAARKLATVPTRLPTAIRDEFLLDEWGHTPSVRQRWMYYGAQKFEALLSTFADVYVLPFRKSTWLSSIAIMVDHQLRSHDAIHVATARENRGRCIATTDDHFTRLRDCDVRLIRDSTP